MSSARAVPGLPLYFAPCSAPAAFARRAIPTSEAAIDQFVAQISAVTQGRTTSYCADNRYSMLFEVTESTSMT